MNDDFIGIYDGALTPEECSHILQRFEASDKHMRGRTGTGVDVAKKDSWDFQFYLNDVADGGETEFLHQGRKIEARQGRLIIAPAGFTHTHKGHVPASGDKYVATSWILYRRPKIYLN